MNLIMLQQTLVVKEMCSYIMSVLLSSRLYNFIYKRTLSMYKGGTHGPSCHNEPYSYYIPFYYPSSNPCHLLARQLQEDYFLVSLFHTLIQIQIPEVYLS